MQIIEMNRWQRPRNVAVAEVRDRVRAMLDEIEAEGDEAINRFSQRFDGFAPHVIELRPWREYPLTPETARHLEIAAERIADFATMQREMYRDVERKDAYGRFGHRIVPLERMAAYIPGGRFPLVSTALMTLIPARVAGVPERVAVSPGDHPGILAAASLAGATQFVRMGGAQAIAALASGCALTDPVDMVVGPGNAYVNAAKALLQDRVKIDTLAGPSEILVLCDGSANPEWVAFDLLAQAEHDPMALSVIGCTDRRLLQDIVDAVETEAARHPEKDKGIIQPVLCRDTDEMIALSNRMGPEHLQVMCEELDTHRLTHYGSLFIGHHSAVALGDYCTGPNHTLPTMGVARQKGGLQVGDFLKVLTWQQVDPEAYAGLAPTGIALADTENLFFHRRSLEVRMP